MKYAIEAAGRGSANYEGLRKLWCETFGDSAEFVDSFYDCFGEDIKGYVILDESGRVCSALTCYPCGAYEGRIVFVSYAICTREDCRGQGLAGMLTEYVKEEVVMKGGISLVSPAEPSLEEYYAGLGYEPVFHAAPRAVLAEAFEDEPGEYEFDEEDDFDIVKPEADIRKIDASLYARYRGAYLAELPHIMPCEELLEAAALASEGFYTINGGDAVCCVAGKKRGQLVLSELIISPMLLELSGEIDTEVARLLAKHFDAFEVMYNMPGAGRIQAMAAGCFDRTEIGAPLPYFGFPIE